MSDDLVGNARAAADNAESDSWPTYFDVGLTRRLADEVERLQAGRVIETVEQLDAAPVGTVVLDDMSDVLQRFNSAGGWLLMGYGGLHLPVLPARVLHMPEVDR